MLVAVGFKSLFCYTLLHGVLYKGAMVWELRCWFPDSGVLDSKPVGGSKVNSAFHSSKSDQFLQFLISFQKFQVSSNSRKINMRIFTFFDTLTEMPPV